MATRSPAARALRRVVPRRPADAFAPPGQFATPRWPVLHQGSVPRFDATTWDFRVWGLVAEPRTWTWDEFQQLPIVTGSGDLHCVTRWSSVGHSWTGVPAPAIVELVRPLPGARFVVLHGDGDYTANLPLEVFASDDVLLATGHDSAPLTADHGAPLRAVIPSRYAWKSVKWLRGIEFLHEDRPGFWEGYGYSNSADPWREERFAS
jgi:DMSO/TMAO reductase YedYZ molybdopterin-dependent catalytic subunit